VVGFGTKRDAQASRRSESNIRYPDAHYEALFRPNRHRSCNGRCDFLNGPFVFGAGNNREAVRCRAVPGSAKTLGVDLPGAKAFCAGLLERFATDLSVRRKGHFKFSSGRACGGERLSVKEGSPNLCRGHRLGGYCRGTPEHLVNIASSSMRPGPLSPKAVVECL